MKRTILYSLLILGFLCSFRYEYNLPNTFLYLGRYLRDPIEACIFKSIGLKEVYGDLLYIRLLQYYGKREFNYEDYLGGNYPDMYARSLALAIVAPDYENAIILSSSILAFGLGRTWEAKSVLKIAMLEDIPQYLKVKYALLLSAVITYEKNKKNLLDEQTLLLLSEIAMQKEASDMFRNIVAFLCEKAGRIDIARAIYKKIVETSNDEYYRKKASQKLKDF